MKKFAGFFVLLALVAVPAVAQDAPSQDTPPQGTPSQSTSSSQTTPDENQKPEKKVSTLFSPKYEISVGYAHRSSYYSLSAPRTGMNGWYGSFDYNWKSFLGFEAEIQGVYKTITSPVAATATPSIYTVMAGPEIFPFRHHKLTPFGHFLYGEGYLRQAYGPYGGIGSAVNTFFSHAWEGGGGLDVHIKPHWSVQGMFDYGSTHFDFASGAPGQGSYRVSAGIVYYFGER